MDRIIIPINTIGESNWVEKVVEFLESYDIEVEGIGDFETEFELPEIVMEYYTYFGGIDSSDFMYNLYKPEQFINLSESGWSFVTDSFPKVETDRYFVFGESPGNDPLCFDKEDYSIWLFSHDPLQKAKVFEDFNQYLKYEIIELQKLMGDVVFEADEELQYHKMNLFGEHIDLSFRNMKFL